MSRNSRIEEDHLYTSLFLGREIKHFPTTNSRFEEDVPVSLRIQSYPTNKLRMSSLSFCCIYPRKRITDPFENMFSGVFWLVSIRQWYCTVEKHEQYLACSLGCPNCGKWMQIFKLHLGKLCNIYSFLFKTSISPPCNEPGEKPFLYQTLHQPLVIPLQKLPAGRWSSGPFNYIFWVVITNISNIAYRGTPCKF